jgi:hypothetical protein
MPMPMTRAIVTRKTLDALIRAKLASLDGCPKVEAMPVTWRPQRGQGCNWTIPGWIGEAIAVDICLEQIEHYLDFLRQQFDISPEGAGAD